MSIRTCRHCRFFLPKGDPEPDYAGECRHSPPVVIIEKPIGLGIAGTLWPEVDENDWCGAWEHREVGR